MLLDPVVAPFLTDSTLTSLAPYEKPADMLRTRCPTLSDTRRLPTKPDPAWHTTDVSDAQLDCSHALVPSRADAVYDTAPSAAPWSVTLCDPVAAALLLRAALSTPAFTESPNVMLPKRRPTLNNTRWLPITAAPSRHRSALFEIHVVPSHCVLPTLPDTVCCRDPMLVPTSVTIDDPVAATLARNTRLAWPLSNVYAAERLPTRDPTLIETRRLPRTLDPVKHTIEVSDSHTLRSHDVCPKADEAEYLARPNELPFTVTIAPPVAAWLTRNKLLAPTESVEYAAVTLPTSRPTLSSSRLLPNPALTAWHTAEVSDAHAVCSHPVDPVLPDTVLTTSPMPDPSKVTATDPVEAAFRERIALMLPKSTEIPLLKLPARAPTLTATRRLPFAPTPRRHAADVSESHVVRSHALPPTLPDQVSPALPIEAPDTVTAAEPVPAALPLSTTLTDPVSTEYANDRLPARRPTVNADRWLPITPDTTLHTTVVSDAHDVCSQAVRPKRAAALYRARPTPAPMRVTLAEPVPAPLDRNNVLTALTSTEKLLVKVPANCPTLIDTRRLPITPDPAMQTTRVSEAHDVCSPLVPSTLALTVYPNTPSPAPTSSTLPDTAAAMLVRRNKLTIPRSAETALVALPTPRPTLIDTR